MSSTPSSTKSPRPKHNPARSAYAEGQSGSARLLQARPAAVFFGPNGAIAPGYAASPGSMQAKRRSNERPPTIAPCPPARIPRPARRMKRKEADETRLLLSACQKSGQATFLSIALRHCERCKHHSRPFLRVRKRFCEQNRAKTTAHVAGFRRKSKGSRALRRLPRF